MKKREDNPDSSPPPCLGPQCLSDPEDPSSIELEDHESEEVDMKNVNMKPKIHQNKKEEMEE